MLIADDTFNNKDSLDNSKDKNGMDSRFKGFSESCKIDANLFFNRSFKSEESSWRAMAAKEVEEFRKVLAKKHKQLQLELTQELSEFTPVLNNRFKA